MATIKHIFKGESLTILFAFHAEYDMARIKSHGIWIGGTEFTGVIIGQGIELKLTSTQTALISGNQRVSLWIDDTILGVRKPYVGDIAVGNTNALPDNESTSEVYDVIVNVDISVTSIEAGDLMFNYVKGDPLTYDDLTPEQKAELKGDKGDPGAVEEAFEDGKIYGRKDGTWVEIVGASGEVDLSAYLKTVDADSTYLKTETDPTIPEWAKAESKPTYEVPEIIGLETALSGKVDNGRVLTDVPANAKFTDTVYTHPASHPASIIEQDASSRFVSDTEKSTWNSKQEALGFTAENVSNKKTTLTDSDTDYPTTKAVNAGLAEKADTTHTHMTIYFH